MSLQPLLVCMVFTFHLHCTLFVDSLVMVIGFTWEPCVDLAPPLGFSSFFPIKSSRAFATFALVCQHI